MADVLYGVKRVVLTELDPATQLAKASGIVCHIETGESADLEPVVSEGEENVARTDEKILAIVRTPDLLYGYDVTFKDNTFDPTIASLIGGGKVTTRVVGDGPDTEVTGFETPMMSEGATMKPFKAEIYVANYEGDSIKNYVCITLNNCKGKAPKFSVGKEFYAPEFEIKAREATKAGKPIKSITYVDALPEVSRTAVLSARVAMPSEEALAKAKSK